MIPGSGMEVMVSDLVARIEAIGALVPAEGIEEGLVASCIPVL